MYMRKARARGGEGGVGAGHNSAREFFGGSDERTDGPLSIRTSTFVSYVGFSTGLTYMYM